MKKCILSIFHSLRRLVPLEMFIRHRIISQPSTRGIIHLFTFSQRESHRLEKSFSSLDFAIRHSPPFWNRRCKATQRDEFSLHNEWHFVKQSTVCIKITRADLNNFAWPQPQCKSSFLDDCARLEFHIFETHNLSSSISSPRITLHPLDGIAFFFSSRELREFFFRF